MKQTFFNYNLKTELNIDNFIVSSSNVNAFQILINQNFSKNIFLYGPDKSGKTHLGLIWKKNNSALLYNNNLTDLINNKKNVFIDDLFHNLDEEEMFHIINHCNNNNLKILITSNQKLNNYNFSLKDLSSRLKIFDSASIDLPDDKLLMNLMIKLLSDKQIIIKNADIFHYILKRVHRSYEKVFLLIENIDKLSLEKKRQLTIPLIKDLI